MKSLFKITSCLLLLLIIIQSCNQIDKEEKINSKKVEVKKPLNPNGDSELAILMREMFEEAKRIKTQVENEEPITLNIEHENILTAHATEPEKAASAEFKAFGKIYLETINSLKKSTPKEAVIIYDNLVATCLTCHKSLCPGPIVRINKLKQKKVKS